MCQCCRMTQLAFPNPNWNKLFNPTLQSLRGESNVTRFTLTRKRINGKTLWEKEILSLLMEEKAVLVLKTSGANSLRESNE